MAWCRGPQFCWAGTDSGCLRIFTVSACTIQGNIFEHTSWIQLESAVINAPHCLGHLHSVLPCRSSRHCGTEVLRGPIRHLGKETLQGSTPGQTWYTRLLSHNSLIKCKAHWGPDRSGCPSILAANIVSHYLQWNVSL